MNGEKGNNHTIHLPAAPVVAIIVWVVVMTMTCVIAITVLVIRLSP